MCKSPKDPVSNLKPAVTSWPRLSHLTELKMKYALHKSFQWCKIWYKYILYLIGYPEYGQCNVVFVPATILIGPTALIDGGPEVDIMY